MRTFMTIAAQPVGADLDLFLTILLTVMALVASIGWAVVAKERKLRLQAQQRLGALQAQPAQPRNPQIDQHNAAIADQHRRLNDLTIAKLTTEVSLLQAQLKASTENADRHEAGKEYHELMVEKAKLEIDSLRLHITEMRKRIEDWRVDTD